MNKLFVEQFQNPCADKRSIPFWAWNGDLDEEELKSQVRQMKEAGVGGFFIHSRIGLETEYLGEKWMSCVKAVVAEAKAQGLYAWLYDEDRWPSGTAGGRVTSCGDAYRCKGLTQEVLSGEEFAERIQNELQSRQQLDDESIGLVAAYHVVFEDAAVENKTALEPHTEGLDKRPTSIRSFRRLSKQELMLWAADPSKKEEASGENLTQENIGEQEAWLLVRLETSAPSQWFNNEAPPDNLNPDCVKKFILETHEKYKAAVGEEFGSTIPGIFTDEPSMHDRFTYFGEHKSWIPWTYGFGAYFQERVGYDFFEVLPLFFFHGENSAKVRHDYWCCVTERYSESYFKVIGEWCQENHLLFTGHFLQEDKLGLCTRVNGAVMPHYQYQHIPGIDMLCEQTREYLTVKQCTSVAHQLGKKQVLSETYGCTGWEFTFEGQKWMGDWQYVLGVNRRCQHLTLYSLRGCRKRDYPPSFNYHTNWWKDNKIVDDYFARLSTVLEQGEAVRTILLLHPAATAWAGLGVNPYGNPVRRKERDVPGLNAYGDKLNALIEYLERQHLDCDLGDELLIRQHGQVAEGQFVVGKASYRTVILPEVKTIFASTANLLLEFMNQGGVVFAYADEASLIDANTDCEELRKTLITHKNWICVSTQEELSEALVPYRTIEIVDAPGHECRDVLYQLRKDGNEYYLFVVNNNRDCTVDATIRLPFKATVAEMELLTGEIHSEVNYKNCAQGVEIPLHLSKAGSAVFYLKELTTEVKLYEDTFAYRLEHENVLPLDRCRYRMENGEWSEELEVWQAQKRIREALGMGPIHHNGIEQRYKWIHKSHPKDGCKLELAFKFLTDRQLEKVALAVERPEDFTVMLNGKAVDWEDAGWLLDKEIRKCILPELVQGENELILSCSYRNDMELENIYLEGDFGVDTKRCLTKLPKLLSVGSWTEQGLKHYCGSVTYQIRYTEDEAEYAERCMTGVSGKAGDCLKSRILLRLPQIKAVCVKVRINAHEILLPWDWERELSIEKWIWQGENSIEIEVVGSPRNMLGPFHVKEKPTNTNDASFCPSEEKYSQDYLITPYGIMGRIEIVKNFSLT